MKACIACGHRTARWWFGGRVCYACAGVHVRQLAAGDSDGGER